MRTANVFGATTALILHPPSTRRDHAHMEHRAPPRHLHRRSTWNPSTLNTPKGRPKATSSHQDRSVFGLCSSGGIRTRHGPPKAGKRAGPATQGRMSYEVCVRADSPHTWSGGTIRSSAVPPPSLFQRRCATLSRAEAARKGLVSAPQSSWFLMPLTGNGVRFMSRTSVSCGFCFFGAISVIVVSVSLLSSG